ncbi:MAG: hypothetical protein WBP45_10920 [Daejeonella sp.]
MSWKESCERYVGFFDMMGFKNLVYRNQHEFVKKKMNTLHQIVEEVNNNGNESTLEKDKKIRVIIFSDSILFVTKDNSSTTLNYLLLTSAWFISKCFKENIPIKGALSYGMISANFDKSIFFGKGMIDAFLLQEELQMYGCILDNQIEKKLQNLKGSNNKWIKRMKVPLKGGSATHLIINWVDPIKKFTAEEIAEELNKFYLSASGIVRRYIDNTIAIIENLANPNSK